jgi:nicotinamidase-related amidase
MVNISLEGPLLPTSDPASPGRNSVPGERWIWLSWRSNLTSGPSKIECADLKLFASNEPAIALKNYLMNPITRRHFLIQSARGGSAFAAGVACFETLPAIGAEPAKASKTLELKIRQRVETPEGSGQFRAAEKMVTWEPKQTALIICDMWDKHWCKGATSRVAEVAPRMNDFAAEARQRGVLIVHAPSSCMASYQDQAARKRAQSAPAAANLPADIKDWCKKIPAEEKGKYPIDQADGGCDCEPKCAEGSPWTRQIDLIQIKAEDAISDSGVEIWNLLEQRGIKNAMILGVHTNMCVLGRPFGLRQMSSHGKNTVLVRDLTDTMYNSKAWPYVNHFEGTDLIVEHVEKYVCPTITSASLLPGVPFRFGADHRPRTGG